MQTRELHKAISTIFVKWGLPTRQAAIAEIVTLIKKEPCCSSNCCNKVSKEGGGCSMPAKAKKAAAKKATVKKAPAKKAKKK